MVYLPSAIRGRCSQRRSNSYYYYYSLFIRRLFYQAGAPWEAETHDLKALPIETTEKWGKLAGAGVPCPVEFEPDDVSKTKAFSIRGCSWPTRTSGTYRA